MPSCRACGFEAAKLSDLTTHHRIAHPKAAKKRARRAPITPPHPEPEDAEVTLLSQITRLLTAAQDTVEPVAIDRVLAFASQRFGAPAAEDAA